MGRPRRVTCAAAMAVATLAILAACGGGDDSGAGHAGDPTALLRDQASGRPSDQASDPYLNQENPRRFIQRWASAEARMKNTGKIAPYVALSRECVSCRQLAHTVARYYAAGGFIHGGAWRIDSIKISPSSQGDAHLRRPCSRGADDGP